MNRATGYNPTPETRPLSDAPQHITAEKLPLAAHARENLIDALDQGQRGTCVAQSIVLATSMVLRRFRHARRWDFVGSPQGLYQRIMSRRGALGADLGASIAEGLDAAKEAGLYPFERWPNDDAAFVRIPPPADFDAVSKLCRVLYAVPLRRDARTLRYYLSSGWPVIFGIRTYDYFFSTGRDGVVRAPRGGDRPSGGHAMVAYGYEPGAYLFQNSWGADYGAQGRGKIDEAYLHGWDCTEACALLSARVW